jgi:hypothetical protein
VAHGGFHIVALVRRAGKVEREGAKLQSNTGARLGALENTAHRSTDPAELA